MNTIFKLLFFLALFLMIAMWANISIYPDTLSIVYSGNLNGELEPCGCSVEGDFGGLKRHATMIDELRKREPDLLFISTGGSLVSDIATDQIKSKYILKGMAELGYDAVGVQRQDLGFGTDFLKQSGLPFVLSNRNDHFLVKQIIKRKNQTLVFYQWLEDQEHQVMHADSVAKSGFDRVQFEEELKKSQQAGYITIVSTTIRKDRLAEKLPLQYIDIVLRAARSEQFSQPEKINTTLLIEAGVRGMRFGRLNIKLDNENRVSEWQHETIDLNDKIEDSTRMGKWYEAYNAELKQDYLGRAEMRKLVDSGASPYAGAETCKRCHENEYQQWQKTDHAHAFKSLSEVRKTFDANCVGCHTVGFEQDGGFIDVDITPHLKNVQCESCHGTARQHVDSKGEKLTAHSQWSRSKMCAQCHDKKHSPVFEMEKYWSQVKHD